MKKITLLLFFFLLSQFVVFAEEPSPSIDDKSSELNLIYYEEEAEGPPLPEPTQPASTNCILTLQDSVLLVGASGVSATSYYTQITEKCPAEFDKAADPGKQISRITELLKEKIAERESSGKKMYTYAFIPLTSNDIASGRSADKLKKDLTVAMDFAKSKNIQVITQTLTPFGGYSSWKDEHLNTINELNSWIKELYQQKQIIAYADFNTALTDPSDPLKTNPEYTTDKMHANKPAGQKKVAEVFIQAFNMAKSGTPPQLKPTSIGFTHGSAGGSAAKEIIPQSNCDNPQRCQHIDEVWAKRIAQFVNPDTGLKVWSTTHGWMTFEEMYAPPPPQQSPAITTPTPSSSGSTPLIPTGKNCGRATFGTTEMRALLDTIGRGEGNYNLMWCGKKFSDFSKHPNIKNTCTTNGKAITSTAAGRYGFLYGTYESLKKKGEFAKDFSLEEQDKAAIKLITQKGITQEQLKTALESKNKDQLIPIFDKIAPVWSSVPSSAKEGKSYYGQHAQSTEKITAYILSCYETLKTNSK